MVLIDLDDFKTVNDTLGHALGDQLLRIVALRIDVMTLGGDTACRYGGDEFVVMLSEFNDLQTFGRIAQKVRAALAQTYVVRGHPIQTTASVSQVVFPDDGVDIESLMRNADRELFRSKAGRCSTVITERPTPAPAGATGISPEASVPADER